MTMSDIIAMAIVTTVGLLLIAILIIRICMDVQEFRNKAYHCSLCGGRPDGSYLIIKGLEHWEGFDDRGVTTKKICICEHCRLSIKEAAEQDRKLREKER